MRHFAAFAVLMLLPVAASAQVYGGEDDPYQQNPFASNSYVPPPPEPAKPAADSGTAPKTETAAPPPTAPAGKTGEDKAKAP